MIDLASLTHHLFPIRGWSCNAVITKLGELEFEVSERQPGVITLTNGAGLAQVHYSDLRVEAIYIVVQDSRECERTHNAGPEFERRFFDLALTLERQWGRPIFIGPKSHARFPRLLAASWAAVWPAGRACVALIEVGDPAADAHVLGVVVMPPQPWASLTAPRYDVAAAAAAALPEIAARA